MGYFLDRVKALKEDAGSETKIGTDCAKSVISAKSPPASHKLADGFPLWHAETIAQEVEREGVCIFWSDVLGELIAFVKNDSFKEKVPFNLVAYTSQELRELFGDGKPGLSARHLRPSHEANPAGGHIGSQQDSRGQG
jgi:hypothetical protein